MNNFVTSVVIPMVQVKKISTAVTIMVLSLSAVLVTACGPSSGVTAPSIEDGTLVEVVTVEAPTNPKATKESTPFITNATVTPAIAVETASLSTSEPAEIVIDIPVPVRREPTDSFTVYALNAEPKIGTVFETLLSKMPDNEVTRAYTRMGDVRGTSKGLGLIPLDGGESAIEILRTFEYLETDNFFPPFWQWPIESRDYVSVHNWMPDLAFDHGTMEQFANANSQWRFHGSGHPPTSYDVALGSFNTLATSEAISACDCEQPEIREYEGVEYYAWGEGAGIGQITDRHKRPMYDHLGRGPHLLIRDGEAYYSVRDGIIDEHIDVIQGNKSSLVELDDWVTVVQWLSGLGLTSEIVVRNYGFALDQVFVAHRNEIDERGITGGIPLMLPMELVASSVGYDGERTFSGLAILHDTAASAEENVERLLARLEGVLPAQNLTKPTQTWAYLIDRVEIQTSGRILIAKLYFTNPGTHWLMNTENNLLVQRQ
ncbi:hypothetical protein JYU04_01670 [Dehalococcoides mccartyi]|nr:hypothetical protein [Dehalococcoides mccartyi]